MKLADTFKIVDFIRGWWATNNNAWPSRFGTTKMRELIKQECGFELSSVTIRTLLKTAGIPLPSPGGSRIPGQVSKHNETRSRINKLRKAVRDLYESLGQPSPDCLNWTE